MTPIALSDNQAEILLICKKSLPVEVIHRKSDNRNLVTTKRVLSSLVDLGMILKDGLNYQAVMTENPIKTAAKPVSKKNTKQGEAMSESTPKPSFVRDEKVKIALESLPALFEKKVIKHSQPLTSLALKKEALTALGAFLDPSIDNLFQEIARDLDSLDLLLVKVNGQ